MEVRPVHRLKRGRLARCGAGILPAPSCASSGIAMDLFSRASKASCVRERDAPATAGETPALQYYPASLEEGPKLSTFASRHIRPARRRSPFCAAIITHCGCWPQPNRRSPCPLCLLSSNNERTEHLGDLRVEALLAAEVTETPVARREFSAVREDDSNECHRRAFDERGHDRGRRAGRQ